MRAEDGEVSGWKRENRRQEEAAVKKGQDLESEDTNLRSSNMT